MLKRLKLLNSLEKSIFIIAGLLVILGMRKAINIANTPPEKEPHELDIVLCEFQYKVRDGAVDEKCAFFQPTPEQIVKWEKQKKESEKIDADLAEMKELCTSLHDEGGTDSKFLIDQCDIVRINVSKRW